jgi:signal transduction histidine kinase
VDRSTLDRPTRSSDATRERFLHRYGDSPKVQSLSRRFSYALISIVTVFLFGFAAIAIALNIARINDELEARLDNALKLAQISLPTPLWNLDNDVVDDFLGALFLDEDMAYAKVLWGGQTITEKRDPRFHKQDFSSTEQSSEFISRFSDILFEGSKVGTIQIVFSRDRIRTQLLRQIYAIIALTIVIIVAISLTSIVITRKYISRPLGKLQESASLIAHGDLETSIDTASSDEIGSLANDLNLMRESIKQLFGELSESKNQLEEYSRTLEQKVEKRTQQLARFVEELEALGELGQAVNSTIDLQTVLTTIVTRAVELSESDGGIIYEFDEAQEAFNVRAAHRISETHLAALRNAPIRLGEGALGHAAATQAPCQVSDIHQDRQLAAPQVRDILVDVGFSSLLAIPLLRESKLVGGLVMYRRNPGEFPERTVSILQTFAAQSVLAIQNARLFREIQDKSRELEITSQHKSQFLANMSHELRTPLNAIIGFSEVLLEKMFGELNEKQEEYLDDIFTSGKHLLALINDVLDLSKIEAGKLEIEREAVDLKALLDSSLVVVRERALAHGISLSLDMADDIGSIAADERKVKQIVFNLLSNAIKFTPDNGEVGIRATSSDAIVSISVWDTGVGIAEQDQQRIFEEFQQAEQELTDKAEGTGLGLALTKKLVNLHGGEIWVESEQDCGSTFTFTLPIEGDQESSIVA